MFLGLDTFDSNFSRLVLGDAILEVNCLVRAIILFATFHIIAIFFFFGAYTSIICNSATAIVGL